MITWRECKVCSKIIDDKNVNGLCVVCLRAKRKIEKEEKRTFNKLDKPTRNVLTYLNKFILHPTDQIIADQCFCWSADKKKVQANLYLLKYAKGELNYYHGEWTGRGWRK